MKIEITGCKGVILERVTQEKDLGVVIDMGVNIYGSIW